MDDCNSDFKEEPVSRRLYDWHINADIFAGSREFYFLRCALYSGGINVFF